MLPLQVLQKHSHSTDTMKRRQTITEYRKLSEAKNVVAKRVAVLSSGKSTYFTIQGTYKDLHEERLFNDLVLLPGNFKLAETICGPAEVSFSFEEEQPTVAELLLEQ